MVYYCYIRGHANLAVRITEQSKENERPHISIPWFVRAPLGVLLPRI